MNATGYRGSRSILRVGGTLLALLLATGAQAAVVVRKGTGANTAALQNIVDLFRADLGGANNGVGGSFPDGRREVNWDGVPDSFAEPNNLPADFFNVNSPRGVVFHSLLEDADSALGQFMVSARASSGVAVRFGDIDASYGTQFVTFSAERLFMPRQAHAMMVKFYQPGTTMPATTNGFGVVFTDVDGSGSGRTSLVLAYSADNDLLTAVAVPTLNGGLSFVGISYNAGERIDHVIVKAGNKALGAGVIDSASVDAVAMDDIIYGEPQPLGQCSIFKDGFQCSAP
jgi:hypothetical protein